MNSMGKRIEKMRNKRGWSQLKLSEISGINNSVISRIESDSKKTFDDNIIVSLADALEISIDYLFGKTENPDPVDSDSEFASRLELNLDATNISKKFSLVIDGEVISDEKAEKAIALLRTILGAKL